MNFFLSFFLFTYKKSTEFSTFGLRKKKQRRVNKEYVNFKKNLEIKGVVDLELLLRGKEREKKKEGIRDIIFLK